MNPQDHAQLFHAAVSEGNLEEVRLLVEEIPGLVNTPNRHHWVPLKLAANEVRSLFCLGGLESGLKTETMPFTILSKVKHRRLHMTANP